MKGSKVHIANIIIKEIQVDCCLPVATLTITLFRIGVKVEVRRSESVRNGLRVRSDHCVDFSKISFRATLWRSDPDFSYRVSVPQPVQARRISEQFRQTRLPFRIGIVRTSLKERAICEI